MKAGIFFLFLCLFSFELYGQVHDVHDDSHRSNPHFRISAALSHTYLPEQTVDGKSLLSLPSFGLDMECWFGSHWGIGLHNDLELVAFEVVDNEGIHVEREFPVLITLDALWRPTGGLIFFGGPGIELEPSNNYWVLRGGMEYEFSFAHYWDIAPILFYDFRKGAYNTFTIGLSVGYCFGS